MRYQVLNDEQIEQLFEVFKWAVSGLWDMQKKKKIEQSLEKLQLLRNRESAYEASSLATDLDQILGEV